MLKTVSSITNAIGALNYVGTWNAASNTPTLVSGTGVKGDYYQVSTAGSTAIDGISNWGVGDIITFNGSIWQRIEGGADLNGVNLSVSGITSYGTRGAVSQVKPGQGLGLITLFTFDIDGTSTYGTYMIEVQVAAQQVDVLPGRAVEARKYIFALNRYASSITASAINSEADSSYSSSSGNYAMSITPSINIVSGTKAEFKVTLASTGAIPFTAATYAAQANVMGLFSVTVS